MHEKEFAGSILGEGDGSQESGVREKRKVVRLGRAFVRPVLAHDDIVLWPVLAQDDNQLRVSRGQGGGAHTSIDVLRARCFGPKAPQHDAIVRGKLRVPSCARPDSRGRLSPRK